MTKIQLNKTKGPKKLVGKLREDNGMGRQLGFSLPGVDFTKMTKSTQGLFVLIAVAFLLMVFFKFCGKALKTEEEDQNSIRRKEIKNKKKNK
jgi:Na+-transporting NADH:ubiquinone oxidoreductase subunit NqrD